MRVRINEVRPLSGITLSAICQVLHTIGLFIMISMLSQEQSIARGRTVEELNKKLIYIASEEIGSKANLDIIPVLYTNDFVRHNLTDSSHTNGLDEFRDQIAHLREGFPDWAEEIKLIVAENDMVATWLVASGTNTGSFLGNSPTGRKTVNNVMSFYRIAGGKFAEQWLLPDRFTMNSNLGMIPGEEAVEIRDEDVWQTLNIAVGLDSDELQHNKDLALLANELVWTDGNFETLEDMFSHDFVQHFLPFGTRTDGLESLREQCTAHRNAFPDWAEAVNLVVAEGDYVFLQFTSTGTNTGSFLGKPPTERPIHINEVTIFRIAAGKIAEQWLLPDILSLNQQLGFTRSGN
jgi:predicted ester cyclase